jgi:type IX secretion system substrate protein
MIRGTVILSFMILCETALAQTIFQKNYMGANANSGYSLVEDTDGYLLTGSTKNSGAGGSDILLIKTDFDGNVVWSKTIGGSGNEEAYDAKKTTDGGFIICGYTSTYVYAPVDSSNMYIVKIDSLGGMQWSCSIGSFDKEMGKSVIETFDGGFVCAGYTYSVGPGFEDIFLVKLNSSGTNLWSYGMGSTGDDVANCVFEKSDHSLLLAGSTTGFAVGGKVSYIIHTDQNGIPQGGTTYEFVTGFTVKNQFATYIMEGYNSDLIFTGSVGTHPAGGTMAFLADIGNWYKIYNYTSGADEVGYSIDKTDDGGYIVGSSDLFARMFKVDVLGQWQWVKGYGSGYFTQAFSIKTTNDGGYVFLGYRYNASDTSAYLIKAGSTVNTVSCDGGSTGGMGTAYSVIIANQQTSHSSSTMFIANDSGQVAIAFPFTNVICFTTGSGENPIESNNEINISPNPANDFITIHYNLSSQKETTVSLFNLYGQPLALPLTLPINRNKLKGGLSHNGTAEIKIDMRNFPAGIYFVKMTFAPEKDGTGGKEEVRKVVKY